MSRILFDNVLPRGTSSLSLMALCASIRSGIVTVPPTSTDDYWKGRGGKNRSKRKTNGIIAG